MPRGGQEKFYIAIGFILRQLRRERRISQASIAKAMNISRAQVINMEYGRSAWLLHRYVQYCLVIGVQLEEPLNTLSELEEG